VKKEKQGKRRGGKRCPEREGRDRAITVAGKGPGRKKREFARKKRGKILKRGSKKEESRAGL